MNFGYQFILEVFAPLILLLVYGRIKLKLQLAKVTAENYIEPEFAAEPSSRLRGLAALGLHLFPDLNAAEQAYFELHLKRVRAYFLLGLYAVTCVTTSGLFPEGSDTFGSNHRSALYVWLSFLQGWSLDSIFLFFIAAFAAMLLATHSPRALSPAFTVRDLFHSPSASGVSQQSQHLHYLLHSSSALPSHFSCSWQPTGPSGDLFAKPFTGHVAPPLSTVSSMWISETTSGPLSGD